MENCGPLSPSRPTLSLGTFRVFARLTFGQLILFAVRHKPKWMTMVFSLMTVYRAWPDPSQKCQWSSQGVLQWRPCALSFKALSVQGSHKQKWVLKTPNHISQGNDSGSWAQGGIRAEETFWNDILVMSYGPFLGILAHSEEEEMEQNFLFHLVTSPDI